jgi:hypothetical protein
MRCSARRLDLRRSQIRIYERMMREHGDIVRLSVGRPACASICTACSIPTA